MSDYLSKIKVDVKVIRLRDQVDSRENDEHLYNTNLLFIDEEEGTFTERTCSICRKSFLTSENRSDISVNQSQGLCNLCYNISSVSVTTGGPEQIGRNNSPEMTNAGFTCTKCGKILKSKMTLRQHVLMKHPKDGILGHCHLCDKTYPSILSLKRHMQYMHSNQQRCKVCYKTFMKKRLLIAHKNICIEAERPCSVCNKIFNSDLSLRNHVKYKHPKNVDHRCAYCTRVFVSNGNLKNHLATHHPNGKNMCDLCGLTFNSKSGMQKHVLYKHSDKSAKCKFCYKVFAKMALLHKHISKNHS